MLSDAVQGKKNASVPSKGQKGVQHAQVASGRCAGGGLHVGSEGQRVLCSRLTLDTPGSPTRAIANCNAVLRRAHGDSVCE